MQKRKTSLKQKESTTKKQGTEKRTDDEVIYQRVPEEQESNVASCTRVTQIEQSVESPLPVLSINSNIGLNVSAGIHVRDKITNGEFIDLSILLDNSQKDKKKWLN